MPDFAPLLVLLLVAAPGAWTIAWRFHRAQRGQDQFLAGRRFTLCRYRHTRDGRRYHPARNPEVARLLGALGHEDGDGGEEGLEHVVEGRPVALLKHRYGGTAQQEYDPWVGSAEWR